MNLGELQRSLQRSILTRASDVDAAVANDAHARIGIYRSAYSARITEALATTFPALQRALGGDDFSKLIREFSTEHPSSFRSIRDYGGALARFIPTRIRGVRGEGLGELARWEWALADAFDAANTAAMAIDLAAIAPGHWSDLRFTLVPSLQRVTTRTNAVRHWRAMDDVIPLRWRRVRVAEWALWRRELQVYFRLLTPDEAHALDLACAGASFGSICEALLAEASAQQPGNEAAMRAATLLQTWTAEGWIASAEVRRE